MPSPIKLIMQRIPESIRSSISFILKALITILAFYILLSHKVQMVDHCPVLLDNGTVVQIKAGDTIVIGSQTIVLSSGKKGKTIDGKDVELRKGQVVTLTDGHSGKLQALETETTFSAIMGFLPKIQASTFWSFVFLAALIKFVGILSSMFRWHLLLRGQGIRFPFWHIAGSFLIGRFLGTFLPSTIGLDGYKLYDASRFSRRTVEVTAATVIEKVLGIIGIFITFLVTLPFGIGILGDKAAQIAGITVPFALGIILVFFFLLFYPGLVRWLIEHLPIPGRKQIDGFIHRVSHASTAYRNQKLLLLNAAFQSFMVHFCTAAMYFFTALAIGAIGATFWQVTFASSIQILATVLSPITIAGEGIRELAQYYLLRNQLGPAESIVSAALGFWAAEALTLAGAFFWWARKKQYRPAWLQLDGKPADLDTLLTGEDYGLEELRVKADDNLPQGWIRKAIMSRIIAGLTGGWVAGVGIGLTESIWIATIKGSTMDIYGYAMILYGLIGAAVGLGTGIGMGLLAALVGHLKGTVNTFALVLAGWFAGNIFILGRFRLFRDIWKEQPLPMSIKLLLLIIAGIMFIGLLTTARSRMKTREFRPVRPILLSLIPVILGMIVWGAGKIDSSGRSSEGPSAIPQHLTGSPNVILLMIDALRADHLGCYGYTRASTPIIDALARQGVRFHEPYGQASWTKPCTASIFTARFPSSHKTYLKPDILPDSVITVAEAFQQSGYYTVGFANNINIAPSFNFHQGFEEYTYLAPDYFFFASEASSQLAFYSILRLIRERLLVQSKYPENYYQDADVVNQSIMEYVNRRGQTDRFFLYAHYMDPHDPYFKHPYNGVGYARVNMPNPDPSMADELRQTYDGEITYLDQKLGELFEQLRQAGLWDNTVILFTADHGEEFFDHGGWWHGTTLYQEQIRIPLICKLPGNQQAGTVRLDRVRQIDIAPTLLKRCGIEPPADMQMGRDLLDPSAEMEQVAVFAEEDHEGNILSCLIDGSWKYIKANPGNPRGLDTQELYRLDTDPLERTNQKKQASDQLPGLEERLNAAHSAASANATERQKKDLSDDEIRKMKALGYVQE